MLLSYQIQQNWIQKNSIPILMRDNKRVKT